MEFGFGDSAGENHHRMGHEVGIEGIAHHVWRPVFREVDMDDLTCGVHTCIGASGRVQSQPLAAEAKNRLFNHTLHGCKPVLGLKAGKGAAIIFELKSIARH